jgi:hypothetical protein
MALEEDASVYPASFLECAKVIDQLASTIDPGNKDPNRSFIIHHLTWFNQ